MPEVVCIGSLNVDLVVRLSRMPGVGETVTGDALERHLGGKGLNQALAAARAGGSVALVGAVGDDDGGAWMRDELGQAGIDLSGVETVEGVSGTALIEVDHGGANRIVVIPGANGWLTPGYTAKQVRALAPAAIALAPLEVPPSAVLGALREAHHAGMRTILNTAPVPPEGLPEGLLEVTDIVVANEHEASMITGKVVAGVASAHAASRALRDRGATSAIVTLGGDGAVWSTPEGDGHTPAYRVTPVDTVAAGDAFCGVLAASLAAQLPWADALRRASAAGALATTVGGAAPSLPTAQAIHTLMTAQEDS
ncbi:MAG: ribokinase [Actinomycetota bacterium]